MSAYYATGGRVLATEQATPAPVLVAFAGPAPQSRLTVLFRIFMVIPQLVVLWLLGVAAMVITIIGWFGALFTGRLPVFAADFLTGYLRWQTRVYAYLYLLTDVYPPFSLDDADYPVRVAVNPGPLNRLAVLFRFFLLIPCWIVQTIVSYGALTIFAFVTWLLVLISGQMPDPIYQALAAVTRFQLRTLGYALMLTSAYPGGLFGDLGAPGSWSPGGPGPQPGGRADGPSWWLVLSGPARKLVGGFIVLGVLLAAGVGVVGVVQAGAVGHGVSALAAAEAVSTDVTPVRNALDNYMADTKACKGKLDCVTALDRKVSATLSTYAGQLRATPMPSQATAANAALAAAVSKAASTFARLGAATSPTQYISEAQSSGLQQTVDGINTAYTNLGTALSS
jgi:Domain of unknown function (DUF4389)